jgi:hypothetical protein
MNVSFDIDKLMNEVDRRAERALSAGAILFVNEVKQTLSVAAPRRMAVSKRGIRYPVARTRATPGAPPRLITGRLRASIAWQFLWQPDGPIVRIGTNLVYGRVHERGRHPYLVPTWQRVGSRVLAVMRQVLAT